MFDQKPISGYDRLTVFDPITVRNNPISINTIDFTHETIPENYWRPVVRKPDAIPAEKILNDKIAKKEWEL